MKVKYYFVFFAIFALVIGGGFYAINPSVSTITFGQTPFELPNAIWLVMGVTLFFLLSLLFFTGNWIAGSLNQYRLNKDHQKLIAQIYSQILQEPNPKLPTFATKDYKTLSKILQKLNLSARLDSQKCENEKIDTLFEQLQEISIGNISKLTLPQESPFWIKNTQNKLYADLKFAQKILEDDKEVLKEEALQVLAQNNLLNEKLLSKLIHKPLSTRFANTLLAELLKYGYKLSQEDFAKIIIATHPTSVAYLELAKTFKSQFNPEYTLALFDSLCQTQHNAKEAYAYLLLDYGMSEKAQDFIAENEELVLPKIYLDLKQSGKTYPLDIFFNLSH